MANDDDRLIQEVLAELGRNDKHQRAKLTWITERA